MPEGLDETMIREVVNRFYTLVRNDEIIGPIFKSTVPNWQWQPHLDTIVEFWSSMLLGSRHDNGQPTPKHPALPELTDAQFGRWLALFRFTVNELCPPDIAAALIVRSEEVGNSFHLNIRMHGGGNLVHLKPHEWEDYLPPEANGDHGDPAMAPRGTGDDDEHELTIGQLAGHTGTTVSALRFYEGKGLIESQRNAGNQRRYRRDMARKVGIIRIAQSAGIPLAEIADALSSLPQDRPATEMDWRDVSNHWNARLQRRIDTLLMLRDEFLRYMDVLYSGVEEATERRSAGRNRSPQ